MRRSIFSRAKIELVSMPFINTIRAYFRISTRSNDIVVNKGDGSSDIPISILKNIDFTTTLNNIFIDQTYASSFTGNMLLKLLGGKKDVYSLHLTTQSNGNFNILDFGTFMSQFPNLYSFRYGFLNNFTNIIKGNLAIFPDSVQRVSIEDNGVKNNLTDVVLDLSGFSSTSNLKHFEHNSNNTSQIIKLKTIGDAAKIPAPCAYFAFNSQAGLQAATGSAISYSGGKIWASVFDTFRIPLDLKVNENTALLADMSNSIVSATGGKLVKNTGWRNYESDSYVSYLNSLGITVDITRINSDTKLNMRYIRSWSNGNSSNSLNIWSEIQALRDSPRDNVALGKNTAIYNSGHILVANTTLVTDGNFSNYYSIGAGLFYAKIDLGAVYPIRQLIHKYYFESNRYTLGSKIEVSEDGVTWTVIYDSAVSGTYLENSNGTKFINTF
ncbi:MAG: discoidin domain-containing protein [Weeksellaceae bacterium]|nr:discoidin domain-containing protein [Bacteroidota bacterium]MCG2780728.1 discoidin domain-containing protein [Weeksellaceae bacterium]